MQFWRLKEDWLRLSANLFGHRYLFDCIVPGGVAKDLADSGKTELAAEADRIFSMLMGEEVPPRRAFIEANAKYAKVDA